MQISGEYRNAAGLIVPNSLTTAGKMYLLNAYRGNENGVTRLVLGRGEFADPLGLDQIEIPVGNGYAFAVMNRPQWESVTAESGAVRMKSEDFVFEADADWTIPISRAFWLNPLTDEILSVSAEFPEPILVTPQTPIAQRTFNFSIYLR